MYSQQYCNFVMSICIIGNNMSNWDADLRDYLLGYGM